MRPTRSRCPGSTTSRRIPTGQRSRSSCSQPASASASGSGRRRKDTGFANVSIDVTHQFPTSGHELGVSLQYTRGWEDEAYFLNEVSPVREGTDMTHLMATEHTLPLSIDYVRPLRTGRLELGTRLQRRWIPVTYTVQRGVQSVIYEGLGDFSDWEEDIVAAYGNLVRVAGAYSLEAGVRIEATQVRLHDSGAQRLLRGERCLRRRRGLSQHQAHVHAGRREPADRCLQPAGRSAGRARTPHLSEVRRSGAAQGRQPVSPAAVHQRLRGRRRSLVERRLGRHGGLPP